MRILFLCTAHNSLSQRLYLDLTSSGHDVSIEYALSDQVMTEAVSLYKPDMVLCPFLTARVPQEIYANVLTLIIHPGPPGDAGPSALDWLLLGDDGSTDDADQALRHLNGKETPPGRTHWGVTIIEAIEDFDAGPVWAFEQFPIDIDQPGLTKSELYRGPITRAAVTATRSAILRVHQASQGRRMSIGRALMTSYSPNLRPHAAFGQLSVTDYLPFQGGKTHDRPLLKAAQRDFDPAIHTAQQISRRIRSADSQPGVLSKVFGPSLFLYGGLVENNIHGQQPTKLPGKPVRILGLRNESICIATCDGKGVWISHARRPKGKEPALWPKLPAVYCLMQLGILAATHVAQLQWPLTYTWSPSSSITLQDIWVDFRTDRNNNKNAYLHFDFYNGAMSTDQCSRLIEAMDYILSESTVVEPVRAVTLMGGTYFSNGIALNVIEAASDPAIESWLNINRINDVVNYILHEFPARGILTIAAIRGNAAAGGVALAAACDIVICGSEVVLNPAYRAIGLHGSEYHTLSYYGRCGKTNATKLLRSMTPMSPLQAQHVGLVDYVFPGTGAELDDYMRTHVSMLLEPGCLMQGFWKRKVDLSQSSLAHIRTVELAEMGKDFWSLRSVRYHSRRFEFVRKVKPLQTPLRFASHRRIPNNSGSVDLEETEQFDDLEYYKKAAEDELLARLREEVRDEVRMQRRMSTPPSTDEPMMEIDSCAERRETLFACYYKPSDDPPTPPKTPSGTPPLDIETLGRHLVFGGLGIGVESS